MNVINLIVIKTVSVFSFCLIIVLLYSNIAYSQTESPVKVQNSHNAVIGKMGFGYFSSEAPVGVRFWISPKTGFDVGIGLTLSDNPNFKTALEAGYLTKLVSKKDMIIFTRIGAGLLIDKPDNPIGDGTKNNDYMGYAVVIDGHIGSELFLTRLGFPFFSISAGIGAQFWVQRDPGFKDANAELSSYNMKNNVSFSPVFGFHMYY